MRDKITVLIPTSPIPSHPSSAIITETIESVRYHMPEVPITILADGVRAEMECMRETYETYLAELEARCSDPAANMTMIQFEEHVHQVGMMRRFMQEVERPYILFLEHDTPICKAPIDWDALHVELNAGIVKFVRFLPEPQIHPEHEHLMLGYIETEHILLRETIQFSARPHIATVDFYRRVLEQFSQEAKCFIEDRMHSVCQSDPWAIWKMAIYLDKKGKDSKRSYHLCGRENGPKFDDSQVF